MADLENVAVRVAAFARCALDVVDDLPNDNAALLAVGQSVFSVQESAVHLAPVIAKHFEHAGETAGASGRFFLQYGNFAQGGIPEPDLEGAWFGQIVEMLQTEGFRGFFRSDIRLWEIFDPVRKVGLRLQPSIASTPAWEETSPVANFCSWLAEADGGCMVHAGSIGSRLGAALLVGPGGVGKSSTVLSAVQRGLQSAGDDYVVLQKIGEGQFEALSVTRQVKQSRDALRRLKHPRADDHDLPTNFQDKYVFDMDDLAAGAFVRRQKVSLALIPYISGQATTRIRPASKAALFRALTETTMRQLVTNRRRLVHFCAEVARSMPAYTLELGTDSDDVVASVEKAISQ